MSDFLAESRSSPIISYNEMTMREGQMLQKGMNFRKGGRLCVFLMSARPNAPYRDLWNEQEQLLTYEGHDVSAGGKEKKLVDQPMTRENGRPSDNGKFYAEAMAHKDGTRTEPLQIQVYEKLDGGVWFDKGIFNLVDARYAPEGGRKVFKFYLKPADSVQQHFPDGDYRHERMIPTSVKVEVYRRDKGVCIQCGANTGLHYDHILPFSKGGRSDDARNIQLLCARHNLQKGAKIQ